MHARVSRSVIGWEAKPVVNPQSSNAVTDEWEDRLGVRAESERKSGLLC